MFQEIHFTRIDSTHAFAKREIKRFQKELLLLITTDEQTAGIGRKGNAWLAGPKESLLGTFIFPTPEGRPLQNLSQILAYSTLRVVEALGFKVQFKWPNDLFLSGKKIAGVMAEVIGEQVIASIGLNVNMKKEFLGNIPSHATSLYIEGGYLRSIKELTEALSHRFFTDIEHFKLAGFAPFLKDLQTRLAFRGQEVCIHDPPGKGVRGVVIDLYHDGRLILDCDGAPFLVSNGSLVPVEETYQPR